MDNNEAEGSPSRGADFDTGLACLVIVASFHNVAVSPDQLLHEFSEDGRRLDSAQIIEALKFLGMVGKLVNTSTQRLRHIALPAIAIDASGEYFILARFEQDQVLIQRPLANGPEVLNAKELDSLWTSKLILVRSEDSVAGDLARFDFTWFLPAVVKYRKLLGEVLLVSLFLQIFALVTPLFFQVIMDKVLVHRSLVTLDVIAVGLFGLLLAETLLSGLRTYVFSHTASRIDVELGSKLFRHLITLPLAYFHARRVGDSVARVRELENIRSFLTGNSITLVIDVLFSVVFIAVMCIYSGWLTLVVVFSLPLYFLVSLIITPLLRARLNESFSRGAENQAFLVESINGIDTLKSMAVEPHITRRWDGQLAAYVAASFKAQTLSAVANESVGLVSKLVTVITLWLGARLVIEGDLSVGQLIAFNMLAGRVSQPVLRLAQLWTDFQQTGIAVQRLGDILNTHPETVNGARSTLPPIEGRIEFDQVYFRYRPEGSEVLRGVSLVIAPGEVIGIVGRSGSGKSTLTSLLQRLYVPERGRVLVDGNDLALCEVSSLRRQIGVVLQDSLLFQRSIRDNIALTNPSASMESVIEAAKTAGAHEFILELPQGYDTLVGEHGASLSGGQRQRVSIARALIGNPRILIFDEATSALDYESEGAIQQNMQSICKGRTVIIIAHRLSTVCATDRIVVMDRGHVVEQGNHHELLSVMDGHYAKLHRMQQGNS